MNQLMRPLTNSSITLNDWEEKRAKIIPMEVANSDLERYQAKLRLIEGKHVFSRQKLESLMYELITNRATALVMQKVQCHIERQKTYPGLEKRPTLK